MPSRAPRCPVCSLELPDPLPTHCPRPSCGVAFAPEAPVRVCTFRLRDHYSLFVLPFSFADAEDADPVRRVSESGRWKQRVFSASDPADVDRTEYFLPYIRRFLFPSLYSDKKGPARGEEPTCRHFEFDLDRLGFPVKDGLALTMRCPDARKKIDLEKPVFLQKVELIAFSSHVAFLVLRIVCAGPATFFDQMDVAAHLRTVAPLYRDFEMPLLECGGVRFNVPQLLAFLLGEFAGLAAPERPQMQPTSPVLPIKPAYDDRMMLYTFSCLDKASVLPDAERCQSLLHRATVINFDDEWSKLPAKQQLDRDPEAWLRTRWQGFSKDGGCMVVFDTDTYHGRYAGQYQGTYYFDIFLLATLQRVTLLTLFERLADIQNLTRGGSAGRKTLRRTRRDLLLFKNQCWFSQITNRERGLVLWKKWQKTLETRTLFREVTEQSAELDSYLQGRHREKMERLMKVGGFLAAAVPTVWGLDVFFAPGDWAKVVRWTLLGLLLLGGAGVAWYVFFRQED